MNNHSKVEIIVEFNFEELDVKSTKSKLLGEKYKTKHNYKVLFSVNNISFIFLLYVVLLFSYNIEQEQKLALETTVLVEQYTVSEHEVIVSCLL